MKSIKLIMEADGEIFLPFAHFEILQGIVYKLISSDVALADEIHNKKPGKNKQFKFFCFTDLHGKYRIADGGLYFSSPVTWEIRSADDRIIDAIGKSIGGKIAINNQPCRVMSYQIAKKHFSALQAEFETDTPIVQYTTDETGFSTYFSPDEKRFAEGLCANIIRKYTAFYGKSPEGEISVLPVGADAKKCVTRYKKSVITGYYGKYKVCAPPDVLEFIYHTGLGAKNSMGFGTVKEEFYEQ